MAQGGGQSGGIYGSPMGASTGGMGGQPTPNMGGDNGMSFAQNMGQLGLFGIGGQQGGFDGYGGYGGNYGLFGNGYNLMPQQMYDGQQFSQFDNQQGMGQIPGFASPFVQQVQQMRQQQPQSRQLNQLNQLTRGQPDSMANPADRLTPSRNRPSPAQEQARSVAAIPQQSTSNNRLTPEMAQDLMQRSMKGGVPTSEFDKYGGYDKVSDMYEQKGGDYSGKGNSYPKEKLNGAQQRMADLREKNDQRERQQRRADRLAKRIPAPAPAPVDFRQMGQAGQFGNQGFAQGLRDYASKQYKDYAYNPTNQTFYQAGDKTSQGLALEQILRQGRAAGYKMASGGITNLLR